MATWTHLHLPRLSAGDTPDVISVKIPGQRIAYTSWISLTGAEFRVHESGRQRCIREGVRNVHAWVTGDEVCRVDGSWDYWDSPCPPGFRRAVYDPWRGGSFVDSETLEPVRRSPVVILSGKNAFYAPEES